jgi:SAM-dependent methyltransferase
LHFYLHAPAMLKSDAASSRNTYSRLQELRISSPKRNRKRQTGWEGFFPYYAGYPETFAREVLRSARLSDGALVLDPWNGSGTTTLAASRLGLSARGLDLNPVMVVVARARLLPPSEADHLKPLAASILPAVDTTVLPMHDDDPLLDWFEPRAAAAVRAIERNIGHVLLGDSAVTLDGTRLDHISGTTATFYVALFSACRHLVHRFQSSNPTWLRRPRAGETKVAADALEVGRLFKENVAAMASGLAALGTTDDLSLERAIQEISVADTASHSLPRQSVDFVLTSPPYCTRIDYTAATRIELAVLDPLVSLKARELGRKMIGSTQVPVRDPEPSDDWGSTCLRFLEHLKSHPSKASAGYYYKTHLDYFDKMLASIEHLADALKPTGGAVLVVQDSYYKDIHNDLPTIISELAAAKGLVLARRDNFQLNRSMAGIHPHSRRYGRPAGAVEAVLCFEKA